MLTAVGFDNDAGVEANKINDVIAKWLLPFKFCTDQAMRA
jgi:hypothetical protein